MHILRYARQVSTEENSIRALGHAVLVWLEKNNLMSGPREQQRTEKAYEARSSNRNVSNVNSPPCYLRWAASISSDRPAGIGMVWPTMARPATDRIPRCWSRLGTPQADARCLGMCAAEGPVRRG
jgi:hypothetical protein